MTPLYTTLSGYLISTSHKKHTNQTWSSVLGNNWRIQNTFHQKYHLRKESSYFSMSCRKYKLSSTGHRGKRTQGGRIWSMSGCCSWKRRPHRGIVWICHSGIGRGWDFCPGNVRASRRRLCWRWVDRVAMFSCSMAHIHLLSLAVSG